jgi:glycosyltransferase involved in cell wall biosynthesis
VRIVHAILTSHFAGSERYAIELANHQAARHEVHFVLTRAAAGDGPRAYRQRLAPGVRVSVVPAGGFIGAWCLRRVLRRLRPDVAHAHLSWANKALRGALPGTVKVSTLHVGYKASQHDHMDGLIAITPHQIAPIPAPLAQRTEHIANWTAAPPFDPAARQRVRARLGLDDATFLVGGLGRMDHSKGFDLLIRAWARRPRPGARLAIVGGGRELEALRAMAPPDVLLPGFSDDPAGWLCAFDAFVSPARVEPFGLVMLEAMAAGLPLRATATEGGRYLQGLIGAPLLPTGDEDALAALLDTLLAQRPGRQAHDLSDYRLEHQAERIMDFYQRLRGAASGG